MVILFAVATYFLVRLHPGTRPDAPAAPVAEAEAPTPPPKIVAPDDDEDFLRDLDRKRLNPEDPDSRE